MSSPFKKGLLSFGLLGLAAAFPQNAATEPQAEQGDKIIDPSPSISTVAIPTATTDIKPPKEVTENATQIGTNSYWWIDGSCWGSTPDNEYKSDFIKQAYLDATEIAKVASKGWSEKYTEASDLYVGKDFHKSKYADEFKKNIAAAGAWETNNPLPWTNWIRCTCDDMYNACGGKIGKDPRAIAAYANNTIGQFGWLYSKITFCDPFFTINKMKTIKGFFDNTPKEDLQMIYMESSGEKFLHEAMHLKQITEKRVHYIDQTFDGSGKRIYGARDVAKAARIASREGFDKNYKNADTAAVFAQAAYWQEEYGIAPPPTISRTVNIPEGASEFEGVQDNQDNYVDYEGANDVPAPGGDDIKANCDAGGTTSLDGVKDIQKQFAGKEGQKIEITAGLECIIAGLAADDITQVGVCGPDTGGKVDYGDMAKAVQAIIDDKKCIDGDYIQGTAPVPNSKDFTVDTKQSRPRKG